MSQISIDASVNDVLLINLKDSTTANLVITVGDILGLTKRITNPPPHSDTTQKGFDCMVGELSHRISELAVRVTDLEADWKDLDVRFVRSMRNLRTAASEAEGPSK